MSESFAALLDESLSTLEMQPGSIVTGVVLDVDKEWVTVHVGLKSEGVISLDEFRNNDGSVEIESGDEVQVALEAVEDGYGETRISREKARKIGTWKKLEEALETGEFVEGKVLTRVKGGFSVEVDVVKAFLPGSLVDIRPVKEAPELENTIQEFKVIKLDYKRNNVVLSRKAVLEKINSAEKVELLKNLDEGQIVKGVVKNLTDYGAFVDLGGLDGLLHITDISWSRVTNPSEVLSLGEEIDVKILSFDKEWVTVHVGLKSEGVISLDEFRNNDGSVEIQSGDEVQVALEAVEDGYGETRISREKARKIGTWKKLEEALETGEFVEGKVLTRVKGGFSVEVDVVKAFLPGSLVDIRPVKEAPELENTVQEFKVIKLDYKRNNVVLSRKAVLEKINSAEKVELLKNLDEGQVVKGIVKNLTDYGLSLIHI